MAQSVGKLSGDEDMTRTVPEWRGATPETKLPDRVAVRLFMAAEGKCAICGVKILRVKDIEWDHKTALINGGENRESNYQLVHSWCHKEKSREDVAEKSRVYRVRKKFIVRKASRMPGSRNSPFRKKLNGTVERR